MIDYDQIFPELLIGSYPQDEEDVKRLRESGVTAVLNLQTDEDFDYLGVDWPALEAAYWKYGIQLRRVPIIDHDPIDLREKLPQAVRTLSQLLAADHTVYVHCTAGVGRSPAVVIAYLHWCRGWDLDRAVTSVKQHRPCSPSLEAIRGATEDLLRETGSKIMSSPSSSATPSARSTEESTS
ncbi:MAG: hypothetical protein D6723_18220 [Acidobacteria bacterium]|nr:MAG: hypothetical protein D6723_18220 [Acidobacteriota bacterium]